MITCTPKSIFSWNFDVTGPGSSGDVTFNWFTEQGTITLGADAFDIVKHGPLSGRWTLERSGDVFAEAHKPSALFRSFEITSAGIPLVVEAQSAFGRAFNILEAGSVIGTIRPAHFLTRRAVIECRPSTQEAIQLFAFWLAALTWKRQKNSD